MCYSELGQSSKTSLKARGHSWPVTEKDTREQHQGFCFYSLKSQNFIYFFIYLLFCGEVFYCHSPTAIKDKNGSVHLHKMTKSMNRDMKNGCVVRQKAHQYLLIQHLRKSIKHLKNGDHMDKIKKLDARLSSAKKFSKVSKEMDVQGTIIFCNSVVLKINAWKNEKWQQKKLLNQWLFNKYSRELEKSTK